MGYWSQFIPQNSQGTYSSASTTSLSPALKLSTRKSLRTFAAFLLYLSVGKLYPSVFSLLFLLFCSSEEIFKICLRNGHVLVVVSEGNFIFINSIFSGLNGVVQRLNVTCLLSRKTQNSM